MNMGSSNSSPLATRLWPILYDLVDAHIRRSTIQLKPWLQDRPSQLAHTRLTKTPSQKPYEKKSMCTTLTYTCSNS
jgi:hypothetical protein